MTNRLQIQAGLKSLDQSGVDKPSLRPIASPVDTFTQTDAGQQLSQLANGLASIAPAVAQYADVTAKQDAEKNQKQGAADARELAASGQSYADAQRAGKISAASNPWYRLGMKEAFGQVSAYKFGSDFQREVQTTLADSTDAADFDSVAQQFRAKWLKDNGANTKDLGFSNGFGPLADSIVANARSGFVAAADGKMKKQSYEAHTAAMTGTIEHELDAGVPEAARAESIHMMLGRALASGMDNVTANNAAIEAITNAAIARKDASVLDLMKGIGAGPTSLYERPSARKAYESAENYIADYKTKQWNLAREHATVEREDRVRATYTTAAKSLYAAGRNAGSVDISAAVQSLATDDPSSAHNLTTLQAAVIADAYDGDPATFSHEYSNLLLIKNPFDPNYLTEQHVGNLLIGRKLSVAQANELVSTMHVLRAQQPTDKGAINIFDKAYSQLSGAYGGELNIAGEAVRNRSAALQFITQARVNMDSDGTWRNMTASQQQETMDKLVDTATKKWKPLLDPVQFQSSPNNTLHDTREMQPAAPDGLRDTRGDATARLRARVKQELAKGRLAQETLNQLHALRPDITSLDAVASWARK